MFAKETRLMRTPVQHIVHSVAHHRNVSIKDLFGRKRQSNISNARFEIWWRLRQLDKERYSFPMIARMFGRNHSTIIYGVRRHELKNSEQPEQSPRLSA